jgi:organic radical activating enzyme
MDIRDKYIEVESLLDQTSSSLCVAKWQQVTLHLQTGHNHSCHHPKTHGVPLDELDNNPSALHNTTFKKQQRKMMLNGQRPKECDYCWRAEDSNKDKNIFSDRITKSSEDWALPHLNSIKNKTGQEDVNPSYVEVSFSNVCNFKCSYCSPEVSSKWMEEIKQSGPYPTSTNFNNLDNVLLQNKMPIPHKEYNPYVEAFWKWWPELYPSLKVFRITGGEPLMTKDTFKVLDYIIENPNPELELNVNSNLCVPKKLLDQFIEKANRITSEGLVKEIKVYTSCEAHGARAEYIRNGLNYNEWYDNCHRVLSEIHDGKLTNMATYNALSVTSYKQFMDDFLKLRLEYNTGPERRNPVSMDVAYLRWPWHQTVFLLDKHYLDLIEDQVTFMYNKKEHAYWPPLCGMGFYEYEINRMQRIFYVMRDTHIEDIDQNRKDFVKFVDEHDRRRGTNFLKTFPEMEEFYFNCRNLI